MRSRPCLNSASAAALLLDFVCAPPDCAKRTAATPSNKLTCLTKPGYLRLSLHTSALPNAFRSSDPALGLGCPHRAVLALGAARFLPAPNSCPVRSAALPSVGVIPRGGRFPG